jgi:hypothetical protein
MGLPLCATHTCHIILSYCTNRTFSRSSPNLWLAPLPLRGRAWEVPPAEGLGAEPSPGVPFHPREAGHPRLSPRPDLRQNGI